jgi:Subtilase family
MPLRDHTWLNLGNSGFLDSTGAYQSSPGQLGGCITALRAHPKRRLVIHFHGGLNNEKRGEAVALALDPVVTKDFDAHPIFVLWETGALTVARGLLEEIVGGKLYRRLLKMLLKHLARRHAPANVLGTEVKEALERGDDVMDPSAFDALDPASAHAFGPAEAAALEADLQADTELVNHIKAMAAPPLGGFGVAAQDEASQERLRLSPEVLALLQPPLGGPGVASAGVPAAFLKFLVKVGIAVAKRYANGTHHGFHATIVEEILRALYAAKLGQLGWSKMQRNAADAYLPHTPQGIRGGRLLVERLAAEVESGGPVEIHIIAQSAGTVHACLLARALANAGLFVQSLHLMVAGCSFELMRDVLLPAEPQLGKVRLYGLSDEAEKDDELIGGVSVLYPHSLLYLVSGALESEPDFALVGMQRHLSTDRGRTPAWLEVQQFLARMQIKDAGPVWSPTAPGARIQAQFTSHGTAPTAWYTDSPTLKSMAAVIAPNMATPAAVSGFALAAPAVATAGGPPPGPASPPPTAAFEGLAAEVAEDLSREALEQRVHAELGPDWTIRRIPVPPGETRRQVHIRPQIGQEPATEQAWNLAHALAASLRSQDPLAWVEPHFQVVEETPVVPMAGLAGWGGGPPPANTDWADQLIQGPLARSTHNVTGAGVRVGHPDTGYTRHPCTFARVRPELGRDLVDFDLDPEDEMQQGIAWFPGHGTRTSSVLLGHSGGGLVVHGVAPDAELVPFRVSRSVILPSTLALAEAIYAAVARKCDVLSISMGGLPSRALRRAVEFATANGVVIIAAAGQYAPFVPWPGRLPQVVTVAGCRHDKTEWTPTCRGDSVDLTAPAADVPVASWQGSTPIVDSGSGTSYATAMTAGVAALWIQKYQVPAGPDRVARFFEALKNAGLQQEASWSNGMGRGLLDAMLILAQDGANPAPLSTAGPSPLDDLLPPPSVSAGPLASVAAAPPLAGVLAGLELSEQFEVAHLALLDPSFREWMQQGLVPSAAPQSGGGPLATVAGGVGAVPGTSSPPNLPPAALARASMLLRSHLQ